MFAHLYEAPYDGSLPLHHSVGSCIQSAHAVFTPVCGQQNESSSPVVHGFNLITDGLTDPSHVEHETKDDVIMESHERPGDQLFQLAIVDEPCVLHSEGWLECALNLAKRSGHEDCLVPAEPFKKRVNG